MNETVLELLGIERTFTQGNSSIAVLKGINLKIESSEIVALVGPSGSGKTTLLYRLKTNETNATIPTIGFNVETIHYGNLTFTCFDIGGQEKIRRLWHNYYKGADAVVFVVDSNDRNRFPEVRKELHHLINHPLISHAPFLIFANKQDMQGSKSAAEITEALGLTSIKNRQWSIQETSAAKGKGLFEGFDWLVTCIKKE